MNRTALTSLLALVALGILLSTLMIGSEPKRSAAAALVDESQRTETPAEGAMAELRPLEARPELTSAELTAPLSGEAKRTRAAIAEEASPKTMVNILMVTSDTGEPIEGVKVRLPVYSYHEVLRDPSTGKAGDVLTSDARGWVSYEVLPGRDLTASVRARDVGYEDVTLEITALAADEVRQIEVALVLGRQSLDYFRLIDRETLVPLAGARISGPTPRDSIGGSYLMSWFANEGSKIAAESDAEGHFQLPFNSLQRAEFQVHADGYGPAFAVPLGEHPMPSAPEIVAVSRAASLAGTIDADGQKDLRVRASAAGYAMVGNHISRVALSNQFGWEVGVEPGGHYSLSGLPPNLNLEVEVLSGWEVIHKHPLGLFIAPGAQGDFDWSASLASTVNGVLVDQARAVEGRQVWLQCREQERPYKLFHIYDDPDHKAVTAIDGSFIFEGVTAGDYWLGEEPGRVDTYLPAQLVHVPTDEPVVLTIKPPLSIRGRVVFEGRGIADARLYGGREDLVGNLEAVSDANGRFELKAHVSGLWRVRAFQRNSADILVSRGINEFEAGTEDAVIELTRTAQLAGRLEDAQGNAISAQVTLLDRGSNRAVQAREDERSTFKFYTVLPGRYALYAQSPNGLAGLSADMDVAAGDLRTDLVIRLEPAATLVLEAAQDASPPLVWLFQGADIRAVLNLFKQRVGTFSVPAGNYRMELRDHRDGDATSTRHLALQTGQITRIQLGGE